MPVLGRPKHELLAQTIAVGKSVAEAAKYAGIAVSTAHALLRRPEIKARIREIQGVAARQAEITLEKVLRGLANLAFSDIRDLFHENGEPKRPHELSDQAAATVAAIDVYEYPHSIVHRYRRWDPHPALAKLYSHVGGNPERMELSGPDGGPIQTEMLSPEERAQRVAHLLHGANQLVAMKLPAAIHIPPPRNEPEKE